MRESKCLECGKPLTSLYRIYYKLNHEVYECYGYKTKNNLIALYADQSLKKLIGTTQEQNCELYEQIGKVKEQYVIPTAVTLKKLQDAQRVDTEQFFQAKLF